MVGYFSHECDKVPSTNSFSEDRSVGAGCSGLLLITAGKAWQSSWQQEESVPASSH